MSLTAVDVRFSLVSSDWEVLPFPDSIRFLMNETDKSSTVGVIRFCHSVGAIRTQ